MKRNALIALLLIFTMLFSGCSNQIPDSSNDNNSTVDSETSVATPPTIIDPSDMFSDRDFEVGYDESSSATIELNGSSVNCDSDAVHISQTTVSITDEGTYVLRGSLDDGMVIVEAEKTDKIQLVLDGVTISNKTCASIYILQADKVFITLATDSTNILSNGGTFTAIDENNIDAVIFSKEDLTFNGSGTLTVTSPAGHGIVSKDELTFTDGVYNIMSASHGLDGKDNICIANAALNIDSGKDGIHAENTDDSALGFVYIRNGTFNITSEGDGISASSYMQIQDGTFDIVSGGGSENAQQQLSNNQSGFGGNPMEGGPWGGGPMGGDIGGNMGENDTTDSEGDSSSMKGIKASADLTIVAGIFNIDSADDALHSNGNLTINGGNFDITTGDDGFHADNTLTIASGNINITESYEGLEGSSIDILNGDIYIKSSDDGLNAAGGTDSSGFGDFRRGDMFSSSSSNSYINISGGTLSINASGDGMDSNGSLTISGGIITVCGPTNGDTAVLDFDSSGVISGGTFIGTGAYMMAQTLTSSTEQGVISVSVGNRSAGTLITLEDANGNMVLSYEPELSFAIVILSSPDITKGETYTITVGSTTGEFEAA